MSTVQHLIAHSRLLNQLVAKLDASGPAFTPDQQILWDGVHKEGLELSTSSKDLGLSVGAGLFPNTWQKDGQYRIIANVADEAAALKDGWLPATFPQTMIKFGFPDVTVHNSVQKSAALSAGYALPGLAPNAEGVS